MADTKISALTSLSPLDTTEFGANVGGTSGKFTVSALRDRIFSAAGIATVVFSNSDEASLDVADTGVGLNSQVIATMQHVAAGGAEVDELDMDHFESKAMRVTPYDSRGNDVGQKITYRAATAATFIAANGTGAFFNIGGSSTKTI